MSLLIGLHIQRVLKASEDVQELVEGRIYPVVAQAAAYPCIFYASDGIQEDGTKDGYNEDTVNTSIMIKAKKYEDLVMTAQAVRIAMDNSPRVEDYLYIQDQSMSSGPELWDTNLNCYTLEINYQFVTKN